MLPIRFLLIQVLHDNLRYLLNAGQFGVKFGEALRRAHIYPAPAMVFTGNPISTHGLSQDRYACACQWT